MATEIKVWQIENGKLVSIDTTLTSAGRTETKDLEQWIKSDPRILGEDILIIGEQVKTKSGFLDFLGIDKSGNMVVIELKRDKTSRDALAQAIDYASDVASWDLDKLNEECVKYNNQSIDEYVNENFEDIEDISFNQTQRILLVGTSVEESLQRMIEWLSDNYGVSINTVILKYIKTKSGDELITRTMIIPEDIEKERTQKQQRKIAMSDEPGNYENEDLKNKIVEYLSRNNFMPYIIREVLLPLCLQDEYITRDKIKKEVIRKEIRTADEAEKIPPLISRELGLESHDFLRQVISYDKPMPWLRENYRIRDKYKEMIRELLKELNVKELDISVYKK